MYPGRKLYGGGMRCGWRGLGRGWSPRSKEIIVRIAKAPLGLSLRGRPHYKPASGRGQGQEGCYGQQSCVVQHLLYPGDEGRAASAQRLCVYTHHTHLYPVSKRHSVWLKQLAVWNRRPSVYLWCTEFQQRPRAHALTPFTHLTALTHSP